MQFNGAKIMPAKSKICEMSLGRLAGQRDGTSDCHVKESRWTDLLNNGWSRRALRSE